MEKQNIYKICPSCDHGKIQGISSRDKILILVSGLILLIPLIFLLHAGTQIASLKLANKAVPVKSPEMFQAFISGLILAILACVAHYKFNVARKLKAWISKVCPDCENGYVVKDRVGFGESTLFFLDTFIFEQILVPMYKTLTFQRFWKDGKLELRWNIGLRFVFYLFIFFGSIPFLIFLLGSNKIIGLVFSLAVVVYLIYMIFASDESERDYQKSVMFLMIPLYYVSMVEIFRWAWVLSPGAMTLIPDESDFLYMGLENLIRTQLFLDLFEVYDVRIGDIDATSFLAHSSIFITRVLLDIAMISLLIRAAVESYRRTWIFHLTGKKTADVTEGETLVELENLAFIGKPDSIHEVHENLQKVSKVIGSLEPYVTSVSEISTDDKARQAALECVKMIEKAGTKEIEAKEDVETSKSKQVGVIDRKTRLLAAGCVAVWAILFSIGIRFFIHEVTLREIEALMKQASMPEFQNDPIGRRELYLKVLKKDPAHQDALMLCSQTFLELADLNTKLLDLNQAVINIDNAFQHVMTLQSLTGLEDNRFTTKIADFQSQAYLLRGKIFFLKNDFDRAISELRKTKSKEIRRFLSSLYLYRACDTMFQEKQYGVAGKNYGGADKQSGNVDKRSKAETAAFIQEARIELGFDPEYEVSVLIPMTNAIYQAMEKNSSEAIASLDQAFQNKAVVPASLRVRFACFAGNALICQGKAYLPRAEEYFKKALQEDPSDAEAILGLANLYRLQEKYTEMNAEFGKVKSEKYPTLTKMSAHLGHGVVLFVQGQTKEAVTAISNVLQSYQTAKEGETEPSGKGMLNEPMLIRERFANGVLAFLQGKITENQLMDSAWSWDVSTADLQRSLCYFYLGLYSVKAQKPGEAADHFRRCLFLKQTQTPEYIQARQELENIQILQEHRMYQQDLFFRQDYLQPLSIAIQKYIRKNICTEEDTLRGLKFVVNTKYDRDKEKGILAVVQSGTVAGEKLLPLLKEALSCEDKGVQLASLEGLAAIGQLAQDASTEVFRCLQSEDDSIRRASVKVMSRCGKSAVEFLSKALQDKDKYVRRDAGYALAAMEKDAISALPVLTQKMADQEVIVRDAAFTAVKKLKEHGIPALTETILKSQDTALKAYCIREIAEKYPEAFDQIKDKIIPMLVGILTTDPDPQSRRWAAIKLLAFQAEDQYLDKTKVVPEIVAKMKESMEDSDPQARTASAIWYLKCVDRWGAEITPALEILKKRLEQGDIRDRKMVAERLLDKQVVGASTVQLLCLLLAHPDAQIRSVVGDAISKLRKSEWFDSVAPMMVDQLCILIEKGDKQTKQIAQTLLKGCGDESFSVVAPLLLPLLVHKNSAIRASALDALKIDNISRDYKISAKEQQILSQALKTASPEIQKTILKVAYAFKMDSPEILPDLLKMSQSSDMIVCAGAVKALSLFPSEKASIAPKLESLLQTLSKSKAKAKDEEESDDEDKPGKKNGKKDKEEEEEEEEESPTQKAQSAVLFTLGVFDGVESAYQRCQKSPELQKLFVTLVMDILAHQRKESELLVMLGKFLESGNPEPVILTAIEEVAIRKNAILEKRLSTGLESLVSSLEKIAQSPKKMASKKKAAEILLMIAPPKSLTQILPWLAERDAQIRLSAVQAISKLDNVGPEGVLKLAEKLEDTSSLVAEEAGKCLAKLGSDGIAPLVKALDKTNPKVQICAMQSLGLMGPQATSALEKLVAKLSDTNPKIAEVALEQIGKIARESDRKVALKPVKQYMEMQNADEKRMIDGWFARFHLGESEKALSEMSLLLEKTQKQHRYILLKMTEMDLGFVVSYLCQRIRERYGKLDVETAIQLLTEIGPKAKQAIDDLKELTLDPNPIISQKASVALQKINQ